MATIPSQSNYIEEYTAGEVIHSGDMVSLITSVKRDLETPPGIVGMAGEARAFLYRPEYILSGVALNDAGEGEIVWVIIKGAIVIQDKDGIAYPIREDTTDEVI